jgi:hypothetical protein
MLLRLPVLMSQQRMQVMLTKVHMRIEKHTNESLKVRCLMLTTMSF